MQAYSPAPYASALSGFFMRFWNCIESLEAALAMNGHSRIQPHHSSDIQLNPVHPIRTQAGCKYPGQSGALAYGLAGSQAYDPNRHRAVRYQSRVTPKYRVRSESFIRPSFRSNLVLSFRFSLAPCVTNPTALPAILIPSSGMPIDSSVFLV